MWQSLSQTQLGEWTLLINSVLVCFFCVDTCSLNLSFLTQAADGKSSEGTQCSSDRSPGCSHWVKKHHLGLNKLHHSSAVSIQKIVYFFYYSYVLEKVDLVIVGAEGVVESGGIINKVCFSEQSSPSYGRSPDPFLFIAEVIWGQLVKIDAAVVSLQPINLQGSMSIWSVILKHRHLQSFLVHMCRLGPTRWPCALKHTTSPSMWWRRVSNLCVCIRSTSRMCQINLRWDRMECVRVLLLRSFTHPLSYSTKQTRWRLSKTCQRSTRWSTTRHPPSSPSSSLTWASSLHLQSAMSSLNFIYRCASQRTIKFTNKR